MRILVTNDDGIDAVGLRALARAVAGLGHEVIVVAPLDDRSGAGAGLVYVPDAPIVTIEKCYDDVPGVRFIGIEGTPALAVMLAGLGMFGPRPWCVAAGINRGANTGKAVLHSGTVGAALTAASLGMSGLAVSLNSDGHANVGTAARVARLATEWLVGAKKRTILNVNVPDVPLSEVRGVRWGRLAAFGQRKMYGDRVDDEALRVRITASALPPDPRTDAYLVDAGYVAVTPISGLVALEYDSPAVTLDLALSREPGDEEQFHDE